jgi:hypothetical protein
METPAMNRSGKLAVLFALCLAGAARAYEPGTHFEISELAARQSGLDATLKVNFGVAFGLDTPLAGLAAWQWVALGGAMEDSPPFRAVNHFHQPLLPWPSAGLVMSSIYWQQFPLQGFGGNWSWPGARKMYVKYLFASSQGDRDEALAAILRGLGQMAHLIQDATSPPHTRNDPHLLFDGYESYIDSIRSDNRLLFLELLQGDPVRPDPAIFTPTDSFPAPSRIARLIDSDTFSGGSGSYSTGGLIGASEYTNGGYLSDDTLFKDFALPRESSLDPAGFLDLLPNSLRQRRYFSKVRDGDGVKHFVAEGSLWNRLRFSFGTASYMLDDRTYADAGRRLMPRAVGYSAALFDYFFREQLEIAAPQQFVYGKAVYQPDHPELGFGQFTKLRAKVRSITPDEPMTGGTLTAVVRYRLLVGSGGLQTDSLKEPVSPITLDVSQAASKPVDAAAVGTSFAEVEFDFSASPIPVNAVDVRLIVVFQGAVGEESSGVAVGIKDLLEPDPVDFVNGTDWECFQGTLHHVADTTLFPPGDGVARDLDGNKTVDLGAPYLLDGLHLKASDPFAAFTLPSDSNFDLKAPFLDANEGARTARVVVLQDQPFYLAAATNDRIFGFGGSVVFSPLAAFFFGGIANDVFFTDFGPVHRITLNGSYRGVPDFHSIVLVTTNTLPCFDRTPSLKPDSILLSPPDIEVNP